MIDPTEDEISFLRKLEKRSVPFVLRGNLSLLKIDRLVPEYVKRKFQRRQWGLHSHQKGPATATGY
jgi:hypothetical protein